MQLAISSAALPDASLRELVEAAERRGFGGVELVAGHGHGVSCADRSAPAFRRPGNGEIRVVGYRVAAIEDALIPSVATLSATLNAPIIAPAPVEDERLCASAASLYAAHGGTLLLAATPQYHEVRRVNAGLDELHSEHVGLALEIDATQDDLSGIVQVISEARPQLRLVRLRGGGPEGAAQVGRGIGTLMAALALARYSHAMVLAPGRADTKRLWSMWLGREKAAWGCGGSADPVPLHTITAA